MMKIHIKIIPPLAWVSEWVSDAQGQYMYHKFTSRFVDLGARGR